jgi:hypothetical protein
VEAVRGGAWRCQAGGPSRQGPSADWGHPSHPEQGGRVACPNGWIFVCSAVPPPLWCWTSGLAASSRSAGHASSTGAAPSLAPPGEGKGKGQRSGQGSTGKGLVKCPRLGCSIAHLATSFGLRTPLAPPGAGGGTGLAAVRCPKVQVAWGGRRLLHLGAGQVQGPESPCSCVWNPPQLAIWDRILWVRWLIQGSACGPCGLASRTATTSTLGAASSPSSAASIL